MYNRGQILKYQNCDMGVYDFGMFADIDDFYPVDPNHNDIHITSTSCFLTVKLQMSICPGRNFNVD